MSVCVCKWFNATSFVVGKLSAIKIARISNHHLFVFGQKFSKQIHRYVCTDLNRLPWVKIMKNED